jgi:hypothetical protein
MYKIAMSPATYDKFRPVMPTDPESLCTHCKMTPPQLHPQVGVGRKGETRPRESEPGQLKKGAKNRVPPALAEHVGRAMLAAWKDAQLG